MSCAFLHKQTTNKQTPSRLVVRVIHVRRRRRPTSAHPAFVLDLANKKKEKKEGRTSLVLPAASCSALIILFCGATRKKERKKEKERNV